MADHPKLARALERNINELSNCILKRRTYNRFLSFRSAHSLDFFRVAMHALHSDLYADAHRVFDRNKDAASFWYIKRIAPKEMAAAAKEAEIDLVELEAIVEKTSHLRDRIHFHIDKRDVLSPSQVWADAGLSGNEFIKLTESAFEILRRMNLAITGNDSKIPEYHGDDIEKILKGYKQSYPDAPISI